MKYLPKEEESFGNLSHVDSSAPRPTQHGGCFAWVSEEDQGQKGLVSKEFTWELIPRSGKEKPNTCWVCLGKWPHLSELPVSLPPGIHAFVECPLFEGKWTLRVASNLQITGKVMSLLSLQRVVTPTLLVDTLCCLLSRSSKASC